MSERLNIRYFYIIIFIFIFSVVCNKNKTLTNSNSSDHSQSYKDPEYKEVLVFGAKLYESPKLDAKILVNLNRGDIVEVLEEKTDIISDYTVLKEKYSGYWVKALYEQDVGYIHSVVFEQFINQIYVENLEKQLLSKFNFSQINNKNPKVVIEQYLKLMETLGKMFFDMVRYIKDYGDGIWPDVDGIYKPKVFNYIDSMAIGEANSIWQDAIKQGSYDSGYYTWLFNRGKYRTTVIKIEKVRSNKNIVQFRAVQQDQIYHWADDEYEGNIYSYDTMIEFVKKYKVKNTTQEELNEFINQSTDYDYIIITTTEVYIMTLEENNGYKVSNFEREGIIESSIKFYKR